MANLGSTDITYTPTKVGQRFANRFGPRQKRVLVSLAFGDGALTYPLNGIPLSTTPGDYGLIRNIDRIELIDKGQSSGIDYRMDHTAQTIMAYNPMKTSPIIVDEVVTLSSSTGTLAALPAYILSVVDSDSNPMEIQDADVAVGSVKAAHVSINFTTGVCNTLTGESLTQLTVSYIPQFSKGFFSAANLVVEEVILAGAAVTGGSGPAQLANRAALVQFVSEPTAANTLAIAGIEESVASGLCQVTMLSSNETDVLVHGDEAAALTCTYLKYAGIPTAARGRAFIDIITDGWAITVYETNSEVFRWGEDVGFGREYVVIPGQGVHSIGATTTTDHEGLWLGPSFPAINLETRLNFGANTWESADSTAIDMFDNSGLELTPELMGGAIELTPKVDAPEAVTLWAMVYGW